MNAKKMKRNPNCVVGWHSITKIYIHLHISLSLEPSVCLLLNRLRLAFDVHIIGCLRLTKSICTMHLTMCTMWNHNGSPLCLNISTFR